MLPRKQMIFDYVVNSHVHPTAQDVFDAVRVEMPNISLATVYRNLNELADAGEIMRIAVPGRPDRFDQSHTITSSASLADASSTFRSFLIVQSHQKGV